MSAATAECSRRHKHPCWQKGEHVKPFYAAIILFCSGEIINNRLVGLLAFNEDLDPVSMVELERELTDLAALRLAPRGRMLKARTLYRLLAVKNFRGSVQGRASVRVNVWTDHLTRNQRSIVEVERMAMAFHREAALLLSRGQSPAHLLEALQRAPARRQTTAPLAGISHGLPLRTSTSSKSSQRCVAAAQSMTPSSHA